MRGISLCNMKFVSSLLERFSAWTRLTVVIIRVIISLDLSLASRDPWITHHKLKEIIIWNCGTHDFIVFYELISRNSLVSALWISSLYYQNSKNDEYGKSMVKLEGIQELLQGFVLGLFAKSDIGVVLNIETIYDH